MFRSSIETLPWLLLSTLFSAKAFAQAQAAAPVQPSMFEYITPFIIIFAIMYFLIIRPQANKMRKHQDALKTLKRGDEVLTSGGILGTIRGMTEKWVTLEIADGVEVKALKSQIAGLAKDANPN